MDNLTSHDSLKIIQAVIDQRRKKYEENGVFLLFWGVLIMIAGISQYVMIQMGKGHISGYAWLFTMIPGAIISYISGYKKAKKDIKKERTPDMLGWVWAFAGLLALANGFVFGYKFGIGFTFALFIPFCVVAMASALSLKNYFWASLVILATILAYISLYIPWHYHPLISASIVFLAFLLPGLQLYLNYKKRKNV